MVLAFGDEPTTSNFGKRRRINIPLTIAAIVVVLLILGAVIWLTPSSKTNTSTVTVLTPGPSTVSTTTYTTVLTSASPTTETFTLVKTSTVNSTVTSTTDIPTIITSTATTQSIICCQTVTSTVSSISTSDSTSTTTVTSTTTATTTSTAIQGVSIVSDTSQCTESNYIWSCTSSAVYGTFTMVNSGVSAVCLGISNISGVGKFTVIPTNTACGSGGITVSGNKTVTVEVFPATSPPTSTYMFQFNVSY